jgi:hypothetical protein
MPDVPATTAGTDHRCACAGGVIGRVAIPRCRKASAVEPRSPRPRHWGDGMGRASGRTSTMSPPARNRSLVRAPDAAARREAVTDDITEIGFWLRGTRRSAPFRSTSNRGPSVRATPHVAAMEKARARILAKPNAFLGRPRPATGEARAETRSSAPSGCRSTDVQSTRRPGPSRAPTSPRALAPTFSTGEPRAIVGRARPRSRGAEWPIVLNLFIVGLFVGLVTTRCALKVGAALISQLAPHGWKP